MNIIFSIQGHAHQYSIPMSAYDDDAKIIQLPNGSYYVIQGWFESYPPTPQLAEYVKLAKPLNPVKAERVK